MNIQPTYSSLDYPGKMALVLFIPGCDLRCKYCHNPQLLKNESLSRWDIEEVEEEIDKNVDFIDAIVISGGEALLHIDVVKHYIQKAKEFDLLIKLDTNGSFPNKLKELVEEGLVDYVAVDIKNAPKKYNKTIGLEGYRLDSIKTTVQYLLENHVDYEFRTTII